MMKLKCGSFYSTMTYTVDFEEEDESTELLISGDCNPARIYETFC